MKIKKKVYLRPLMTVLEMEAVQMLATSTGIDPTKDKFGTESVEKMNAVDWSTYKTESKNSESMQFKDWSEM